MKFTTNESCGECVAYLDGLYLIINDTEDGPVALSELGVGKDPLWVPYKEGVKKFYKGDSVTITF